MEKNPGLFSTKNLISLRLKGTVHPKMNSLSSFTHPQVDQTCMNAFVLNTKEDILKKVCNQAVLGTIDFNSRRIILLCFPHSSEYLPLCSEQTHSYRFGST